MRVRSTLVFMIAVLGIPPLGADEVARAPQNQAAWIQFDKLVADAKSTIMTDPKAGLDKARRLVSSAERQYHSPKQQDALATGLWLVAEALTRSNQISQAGPVLARAIKIASSDHNLTPLNGNLALSLARVAHTEGDVTLSLKSYQQAYDIFAKIGQPRGKSLALQGLGVIYEEARDFPRAVRYYTTAAEVYSEEPALQLSFANNMGIALQLAGRYAESLTYFKKALTTAKSLNSRFLQARILTNIAFVQTKLGNFSAAQNAADAALKLGGTADGNGWAPFIWGVKAEIEFKRGSLSAAAGDLEKAFRGVDLTKTIAPFRDTHELAYRIYSAIGNSSLALAHLEAFKRLDDEARSLAASTNLALMSARFDFANQRLEIEHLKTEQLQREASLKESRAATQRVLFLSLIFVAALVIVWISWRHRLLGRHRDLITRANAELTRILGERDQEIARRIETETHLRVAMEAAEQANRAKTQFLANMSHELRTPLNAIIGFSEIIASGIVPQSRAQEYSGDINASGKKLLVILNDILDTARLDAGSVSLSEEDVALGKTIDLALAKASKDNDFKDKDVRITGDKSLRIRGDSQRLIQVIEKLISNAAKFTSQHGNIAIALDAAEDGGVDITVTDDGIGIPAEQISHIMDRFGQIESPYARSHGGIGLGLPIVKSLIALHGGTLHIESEVEKGTLVCVHLPAERRLPSLQDASDRIVAA